MRVMSKYCKAYPLSRLREFDGWNEHVRFLKKKELVNGEENERELQDSDILFLQEDFTVTSGIFMAEGVVFDCPARSWTTFCKEILQFEGRPS
ncbi:MAG TPA: hypothetical protein VN844_18750 [Pyrinomonadaceae bacterium]|nr:hypothetical protein [Pyrinomonadaceae bacterium]